MNNQYAHGTPYQRTRTQIQMRRLRLISDIMEDYQDNIRRVIGLLGNDETPLQNVRETNDQYNRNLQNILQYILQTQPRRTSAASSRQENNVNAGLWGRRDSDMLRSRQEPAYSFNRLPRGFTYYTQFMNPHETAEEGDGEEENDYQQVRGISGEQMTLATELIRFDSSMNQDQCPITWDYFQTGQNVLQINRCGHIFGVDALTEWFRTNRICPVCRRDVITNQSPVIHRPHSSNSESSEVDNTPTRPVETSNRAINQIISGILSGVNGSINSNTGYYESEFELNMSDFIDMYRQFVQPPSYNVNTSTINGQDGGQ